MKKKKPLHKSGDFYQNQIHYSIKPAVQYRRWVFEMLQHLMTGIATFNLITKDNALQLHNHFHFPLCLYG